MAPGPSIPLHRHRAVMNQSQRTLQEFRTSATPAEVLAEAKVFFTRRNSIYATFIDRDGPTFVSFVAERLFAVICAPGPAVGAPFSK